MPEQKTRPDPATLAKPRAIEHLVPGSWWLVDYVTEGGEPATIWAQVRIARALTGEQTGTKYVEIGGVDTDGDWCELRQIRGFGVPQTLRAADARRAGLEVPANA